MADQRPVRQSSTPSGDSFANRPQVSDSMTILMNQNINLLAEIRNLNQRIEELYLQISQQAVQFETRFEKTLATLSSTNNLLTIERIDLKQENQMLKEENQMLKQENQMLKNECSRSKEKVDVKEEEKKI